MQGAHLVFSVSPVDARTLIPAALGAGEGEWVSVASGIYSAVQGRSFGTVSGYLGYRHRLQFYLRDING
jgi:hypothetical protein